MRHSKISLKEAVKFHGHLGPYLILGVLAGEIALRRLGCRKYFGLEVKAWGVTNKPKSCLIDGLQLSTGSTYGKGNIQKAKGKGITILFKDPQNNKKMKICLKDDIVGVLDSLKGHEDCEKYAKALYGMDPLRIFNLTFQRGS